MKQYTNTAQTLMKFTPSAWGDRTLITIDYVHARIHIRVYIYISMFVYMPCDEFLSVFSDVLRLAACTCPQPQSLKVRKTMLI